MGLGLERGTDITRPLFAVAFLLGVAILFIVMLFAMRTHLSRQFTLGANDFEPAYIRIGEGDLFSSDHSPLDNGHQTEVETYRGLNIIHSGASRVRTWAWPNQTDQCYLGRSAAIIRKLDGTYSVSAIGSPVRLFAGGRAPVESGPMYSVYCLDSGLTCQLTINLNNRYYLRQNLHAPHGPGATADERAACIRQLGAATAAYARGRVLTNVVAGED